MKNSKANKTDHSSKMPMSHKMMTPKEHEKAMKSMSKPPKKKSSY